MLPQECIEVDDPSKCSLDCANRICVDDRFDQAEKTCYAERIQTPLKLEDQFGVDPSRQEEQMRKYHTALAYLPGKIDAPLKSNKYLLWPTESKYREMVKTYFPVNEFKQNTAIVGYDARICSKDDVYVDAMETYVGCPDGYTHE